MIDGYRCVLMSDLRKVAKECGFTAIDDCTLVYAIDSANYFNLDLRIGPKFGSETLVLINIRGHKRLKDFFKKRKNEGGNIYKVKEKSRPEKEFGCLYLYKSN